MIGARNSVLLAQERLWETNCDEYLSPEEIAEAYLPFSNEAMLVARNRALQQEQKRANSAISLLRKLRSRRLTRHRSDRGESLVFEDGRAEVLEVGGRGVSLSLRRI